MTAKEQARLELLKQLDAEKTPAEKNRLGQFATPPVLASEMVTSALLLLPPKAPIRFLEPGFGTGPFYSALLTTVSPSRIDEAVGFEMDTHFSEPLSALWQDTPLQLHTADFTKEDPPADESAKFNLVVCNPPYVRHHHLNKQQKRDLQTAIAKYTHFESNGLSGLYTYFLILSQGWMSAEGVAVWLIPSEFMDVNYGRLVKEFLLQKVTLLRIHRFDPNHVQFDDALVSSAVVFLKNTPTRENHVVEFTFGRSLTKPEIVRSVAVSELAQIGKWSGLPQSPEQFHLKEQCGTSLADLFSIKRGLATGCNSYFVLIAAQAKELKLPSQYLQPILPSPRDLATDEISADADGMPLLNEHRYLLSCSLDESEVKKKHSHLWKYLQSGRKEKIHERYLCRHRNPWYAQEHRPPAPFLCSYMGRTTDRRRSPFRFILNHSKATAANVYLMLYPKPILQKWLDAEDNRYAILWQALSSISAEMLKGEGRSYGGGLHKLEPKELGNVAMDALLHALPDGKQLHVPRQMQLFST